jgi:hypothetical protein
MNFEFALFSLASILTSGLGFQKRYACEQYHAKKLIANFELACKHSQKAIDIKVNLKMPTYNKNPN